MRYWCLITSPKNWEVCKMRNLWGLDYGYERTWDRYVSQGDAAVVYVNGRGFSAVLDVTGVKKYSTRPLGWTKLYPYRFGIRIRKEADALKVRSSLRREHPMSEKATHFRPSLIDDLVFITDKGEGERGSARWNSFFYPSVVAIPAEDFETLDRGLSPGHKPRVQSSLRSKPH